MDSQQSLPGDVQRFGENFRPSLHFTPEKNWINDPNGLLFHNGKYHLFFQHNPQGNLWGNMSWGHAVSRDLFHWEHLPVAISCDETFGIFSGSAVMDYKNTTGFGTLENPAMVAIYTAHRHDGTHQAQHLAYSLDEGLTWSKCEENPVLDLGMKDFRDPKVSWEESTSTWLMTIAKPEEHKIAFFRSSDLKQWQHLSDFGPQGATGGCWECPDLFPLTDENGVTKWVLLVSLNPGGIAGGSGTQYFIGNWDGSTFTPDHKDSHWIDYGRDNYAGVTFNNTGDRRIFLAWMSNWLYANEIPTEIWRGSMTLPRTLTLTTIEGSSRLLSTPIENQLAKREKFSLTTDENSVVVYQNKEGSISVGFNAATRTFYIDRSSGWLDGTDSHLQESPSVDAENYEMEIFIDHGSVEVFVPSQALSMTSQHLLSASKLERTTLGPIQPHA